MKRDWDVIRAILVSLEELPDRRPLNPGEIKIASIDEVSYNMNLLVDRRFIEGQAQSTVGMGYGPPLVTAWALTWSGHELLDSIRQESTWSHVKETAISKGLDLTFDVVVGLARAYISSKTGMSL